MTKRLTADRRVCGFLLILLLMGSSCHRKQKNIEKTLSQMIGKEVIFPNTLQAKVYGKDTVYDQLNRSCFKIITYADSTGCTDCRLNFYGWRLRMEEVKTWNQPVEFVFILQPKNDSDLYFLLRSNQFSHAVWYDYPNDFMRLNELPEGPLYQTFLVDSQNTILLVGNPIGNKKMWDLYQKAMDMLPATQPVEDLTQVSP